MTDAQRTSLINLMGAILACSCTPADIRFRARNLAVKLSPAHSMSEIFDSVFGGENTFASKKAA